MRIRAGQRSCVYSLRAVLNCSGCAPGHNGGSGGRRVEVNCPHHWSTPFLCAFTLVGGPGAHVRSVEGSTRSRTGQCTCNCSRKATRKHPLGRTVAMRPVMDPVMHTVEVAGDGGEAGARPATGRRRRADSLSPVAG